MSMHLKKNCWRLWPLGESLFGVLNQTSSFIETPTPCFTLLVSQISQSMCTNLDLAASALCGASILGSSDFVPSSLAQVAASEFHTALCAWVVILRRLLPARSGAGLGLETPKGLRAMTKQEATSNKCHASSKK